MKKVWLVAMVVALLAVFFAGCGLNSLESYKRAVQRTEEIKKGQVSGDFTVTLDFDSTGLTEAQIKDMNYYRNMEGSFHVTYDHDAQKTISRNYVNLGGLGFDADFYLNGQEMFLKMPIAGKYLRLDEMIREMETKPQGAKGGELISPETVEAIQKIWLGLIQAEDVFTGKNIILTTPDGEVKSTQYSIHLQEEQIKALMRDTTHALFRDERLKSNFEGFLKKNFQEEKGMTFDQLYEEMEKSLASCRVEAFQYDAYVDIDGYIVNEIIEFRIKFNPDQSGRITELVYKLEIKNWDINQEQEFKFPVLTPENTLDWDEMDQNMPSLFEDLIERKD